MNATTIRNIVTLVVLVVWVANFILAATIESYEVSESVNAIFAAIVTGNFIANHREENREVIKELKQKRRSSKGTDDDTGDTDDSGL